MKNENKESPAVKELMMSEKMRNGEALKMIEAFKKHTPEYAEMKHMALVARFRALQEENKVRCTHVGMENKETLRPLLGDKNVYLEKVIGLIEDHKIAHPDFNFTEEELMEKKRQEIIEKRLAEKNEAAARDLADKKKALSANNNECMMAIAIGIAAVAAGSGTLALVSFTTAYMISEFSSASQDLKTAQELVNNPLTMDKVNAARPKDNGMER